MAIRNIHYAFAFVDIGSYGSNNDSNIFGNSTMRKSFSNKKFNSSSPDVVDECSSLEELHSTKDGVFH